MANTLWFLTDGITLLDIYQTKKEVERAYYNYQDDPDFSYYDYYGIDVNELEDYPDEYDFALEQGFL